MHVDICNDVMRYYMYPYNVAFSTIVSDVFANDEP